MSDSGMHVYTYVVKVTAANMQQADTVMDERLQHDEDLGFPYTVEVV